MEYAYLGGSGLKVSPLCLGTMLFGAATDRAAALRIIGRARDEGINFLDTSDAYAGGESERIIGDAIQSDRANWILASKCGLPTGAGPNGSGGSRHWIYQALEASLKRLKTDYVDIYYVQVEDIHTRLSEMVGALGDLIKAGKIRYFALSNYKAWRLAEICNLADAMHIDRPVASQPSYNIVNRTSEVEHLAACHYYGVGVVASSPLARGVLTGKYEPGASAPADSRAARNDKRLMETEWRPESIAIANEVRTYARERGMTAAQFATLWVLNNRYVTSAIAGPRTESQWDEYLGTLKFHLNAEDEAFINRLVPPGAVSTHGYNDPVFPIEGRVPKRAGDA